MLKVSVSEMDFRFMHFKLQSHHTGVNDYTSYARYERFRYLNFVVTSP